MEDDPYLGLEPLAVGTALLELAGFAATDVLLCLEALPLLPLLLLVPLLLLPVPLLPLLLLPWLPVSLRPSSRRLQ